MNMSFYVTYPARLTLNSILDDGEWYETSELYYYAPDGFKHPHVIDGRYTVLTIKSLDSRFTRMILPSGEVQILDIDLIRDNLPWKKNQRETI